MYIMMQKYANHNVFPLEKYYEKYKKYKNLDEPIHSIRATDPDDLIGFTFEDYCRIMKINENASYSDQYSNQIMYYDYFKCVGDPYKNIVQKNLYEALIWSYPVEFFRDRLIKDGVRKYANKLGYTDDEKLYVEVFDINKDKIKEKIKQYLDAYGYYLAREVQTPENIWHLYYEARYDLQDMTEYVYEILHGLVFHVTKKKYLSKIMRYGLIPKSQNKGANYPDRIYVSGYRGEYGFEQFTKSLSIFDKEHSSDWCVLAIDLTAHPLWPDNFIRFFRDPNSPGKTSFYTVENIPPICLNIHIENLKV